MGSSTGNVRRRQRIEKLVECPAVLFGLRRVVIAPRNCDELFGSTPESVGAKLSELVISRLDFLRHGRTKEWRESHKENLEPCDSRLGEIILPP